MHVNARECVLNVLVEDPLETLALRVLLGRAPHLVGERGDRLGSDGAVGRALGRVSRSLSSIHGLQVGERDTRAGNELGLEVLDLLRPAASTTSCASSPSLTGFQLL